MTTCPFFSVAVVWMSGLSRPNIGATSELGESSFSLLVGSSCRASCLSHEGTWESGGVAGATRLLCRAGPRCHCSLSLRSLCSVRRRRDTESARCVLHLGCLLDLSWGRQEVLPVLDLFLPLPTRTLLKLLLSSRSPVTRRVSFSTWAHLSQGCLTPPPRTGVTAAPTRQPDPGCLRVSAGASLARLRRWWWLPCSESSDGWNLAPSSEQLELSPPSRSPLEAKRPPRCCARLRLSTVLCSQHSCRCAGRAGGRAPLPWPCPSPSASP